MPTFNDRASCQHLTYKFASFYGCTLGEMCLILAVYAVIELPILLVLAGFLSKYLGGYFGAFLLLFLGFAMLTFFILLKQTAKRVGKLRKGRPAGYLTLKSRQILHQYLGASTPYVTRNGNWSSRRKIK